MSDPMKQAWNDVADGFTSLGRLVKSRYQGEPEAGDEDVPPAAERPDPAGDVGTALRDALQHLVDAGRDLGDRAADVARDDDIKEQAKRAAASLNDALSATVDMIGEQVGSLFKRPDATPSTTDLIDPPVETTATDATTEPDTADASNDTESRYGSDESPA